MGDVPLSNIVSMVSPEAFANLGLGNDAGTVVAGIPHYQQHSVYSLEMREKMLHRRATETEQNAQRLRT